MNAFKVLVSIGALACILLSACVPAPAASPAVTVTPAPAASPAATVTPAVPTATLAPKNINQLVPIQLKDSAAPSNIGSIVATIPFKYSADIVTTGAGAVWVGHSNDGMITRIDPSTNTVVAQIQVGQADMGDHRPTPGDITVVGDQVWATVLTVMSEGEVVRIDPAINQVVQHIPLGSLEYPNGTLDFLPWGIAADGNTLWVSDFLHNGIARVDTQTQQVTKLLNVANVYTLTFDTDSDTVWAPLHRTDSLARIDPQTNTVVATIPLPPGGSGPDSTCGWCIQNVAVGAGSVWVALGWANGIAQVDPATNQVVARIDLEGIDSVAYNQGYLWVTSGPDDCNSGKGSLMQIDPKTYTVIGKMLMDSPCPGEIAFDGNSLWVGTDSSVTRIQLNP